MQANGTQEKRKSYYIGQKATLSRTITETDIRWFAGLSGDFNPVHVDEIYARQTRFGGRIAHGLLTASLFSTLLGMYLPGPGTVYLSQTFRFSAPVRPGDTVTAAVEVTGIREDKGLLTLATTCTNQDGQVVLSGEATVLAPPPEEGLAG